MRDFDTEKFMLIVSLKKADLAFGLHKILDKADLSIEAGERLALIGRNGAGKTSLVSVIASRQSLDDGECWVAPHLVIGLVGQNEGFDESLTVLDIVVGAVSDRYDEWDREHNALAACDALDLIVTARFGDLSGGERKRVALAAAIARKPDLLILDEPTNHLDITAIEGLEKWLKGFSGAILLISHDRHFLDEIAHRIVEIDRGILRSYPGDYSAYQRRKAEQLEAEAKANAKFDRLLAEEEVWIRRGIEARRTRNEGRVRRLEELRRERLARREIEGEARFVIDAGQQSGKIVATLSKVSKAFGQKTVIDNLSCCIMRGERIGLVGPNGSGKSTLLKLILGEVNPDRGTIERGSNLNVAYFDQRRQQLDDEKTLIETISTGGDWVEIEGKARHAITYLGDFLFSPERARAKVGSLSGGERNRLLLARLFSQPANLLVLDEPTNDLDIDTLEMLEDQLLDYAGTVIVVSHDRAFLDNVTTQLIASEGDGRWTNIVGGYADWRRWQEGRARAAKEPKSASSFDKAKPVRNRSEKLTFKEKGELESLPGKVDALESEQQGILEKLKDPDLYRDEPGEIKPLQKRLIDIETQLEVLLARWVDLEAKT